jgi:hypothetical protein
MKEISDLHYLSPSGCTFWGKKPWSRKKKILLQLGTLIGAPIGIALVAGVAVPAILIGLPIWSGRKVYMKLKNSNKHKRNFCVVSTVVGSLLISPVVATLTVGIGVPILLAYVYGVVPISLCRSGGCGVTTNTNGVRLAFDDEDAFTIAGVTQDKVNSNQSQSNQQQQQTNPDTLDDNSKTIDTITVELNQSPKMTKALESASACGIYLDNDKIRKNKKHSKKTKKTSIKDTHSININPSIGDASIGGDMASGEDDDEYIDDDVDGEILETADRDSASNRALAGSTKKTLKFNVNSNLNENNTNNQSILKNTTDVKSFDSFSVNMSVKSYNPSCIGLAGSLKDNQSVESVECAKEENKESNTDRKAIHTSCSASSLNTSKSSSKSNTSHKSSLKSK